LDEFTKNFVYFLAARKSGFSAELLDRTKALLLDYLGALCAGWGTRPFQVLLKGRNQGMGRNLSKVPYLALQYGVAAHALELDDAHRYACVHPGSVIFSTALPMGEYLGSSGKDFISAVVTGYEAMCRIAYGLDLKEQYKKGFHPTGTCGPFGAAATAAKLLKLNVKQWESGLGIAGSMASGSMQFLMDGTWTKPFHSGWAAHNGIHAALLAKNGFKGPSHILEGTYGFWKAYGEAKDKSQVLEDLGQRYEILKTTVKRYPCCGHTQSSISALAELIQEQGLKPETVKEVEIRLSKFAMPSVAEPESLKRNPKTGADAMWSIYYGAAFTILKGTLSIEAYKTKFLSSTKLRQIIDKIRVVADPTLELLFPEKWPSIVTVTTMTGEKLKKRIDYPKGDPENFLSWEELSEKFSQLTHSLLSKKRKSSIIQQIKNLERIKDIGAMTKLLRSSHR
jgi:2-methylcitrate dehydratase PrpD